MSFLSDVTHAAVYACEHLEEICRCSAKCPTKENVGIFVIMPVSMLSQLIRYTQDNLIVFTSVKLCIQIQTLPPEGKLALR